MSGVCLRCGGLGHFARGCPTTESKGKGKGAKGGKGGVDFRFKGKGESVKGGWNWYGKSGFTDNGLAKGNKGKSGGKGYQVICWLCGEVGHKAAECGGKERRSGGVEAVEEEEVVADVGGVWTIASVENGRTKAKGWRRPTKKEAALRRRSTEVALVHKNNCGVLEVDCGDLDMYAVEASAQVHELDVAQVSTEITIDSAAEESVCPQKWAESFGLQAVDRPLKLVNASGGRIEHFGKRAVSYNPENCARRTMEANFEVTNVRKPLMALARVVDAGNVVQFGPRPEDNFVMHVGSNDKVYLRRKGNSFVLKAEFTEAPF